MQFRVLDLDGQTIVSDNSSVLIIQALDDDSSVTGETQQVARQGTFFFSEIEFVATPQSVAAFKASAPFIQAENVQTALQQTSSTRGMHSN